MLGPDGKFNRTEGGVVLNDDHYRNIAQEARRWGLEQRRGYLDHHTPHDATYGEPCATPAGPRCVKCNYDYPPEELHASGRCHLCEILSRIPSPIPEVPMVQCAKCGYGVREKDVNENGQCIWCCGHGGGDKS